MGNFKFSILFTVCLSFLICNTEKALGQVYQEIDEFTEVNGDFQEITGVQQDNLGNLWVASNTHILKYNSSVSEVYNRFRGIPEEAGKINNIFIDSRNRIFAATASGLLEFDSREGNFVAIPAKNVNVQLNVEKIIEDEDGKLWLGARNGIWNYSGGNIRLVTSFPAEQSVNDLVAVKKKVIFGTSKGLFSLNKNSNHYSKIPLLSYKDPEVESLFFTGEFFLVGTTNEGLYKISEDFSRTEKIYTLPYSSQQVPISAITANRTGNFYISTRGDGLIVLDENFKLLSQHRLNNGNDVSIADSDIKGLYADEFNTLWIYTVSGQLHSLNTRQKYFEFLRNDPQKYSSLADNVTSAIEKDTNGNIWFGTREGLSIWNVKNNSWQHLKNLSFTQPGNEPDVIKDLQADDIHMWVATYNDGLYKVNINTFLRAHYSTDSKTKSGLQKVNAVLVDANKNIWAGGEEGDLIKITPGNDIASYPLDNIEALHQLSSGNIIAAGKKGVYSLAPGANEFIPIPKLQPGWEDLPYFTINSISETPTGEILLATEGAGIVIYDPVKDSFTKINKRNGLPSNRIRGLIMNGQDEVWAGTSRGLIFIEMKKDSAVRVFDKDAGLLSPVFTRGSYARLDSQLAFGTYQGVSIFDPEKIKATEEIAPKVILGSIYLNSDADKELNTGSGEGPVELAHNENSLNFEFYANNPGYFRSLEYSWKLEGYDQEWSTAVNQKAISYANLAPGNYTFLVKARKPGGKWSNIEEVSFEIGSPWWMSPVTYILAGILLLAICFLPFLVFRINKRKRSKTAKTSFVQDMSQEMGTSLTVLLASLNTVAEEEDVKNKSRLRSIIQRLQEILEPILNSTPGGVAAKRQIKLTKIKLEEYMQDLVKDLDPLLKQKSLEIIVNDQWNSEYFCSDKFYLNKIFFNIISNSIKYSFNEGKIIINLIQTNRGDLKVQIADNGLGLPTEDQKILREYYNNPKSTSTKGISEKINLLYVKDLIDKIGGSVVFESSKDQGTTFTLILKNHQKTEEKDASAIKSSVKEEPKTEVVPVQKEEEILIEKVYKEVEKPEVKILIAEDNDELRKVFVESFKKLGEVYEAKRGMEAYQIATTMEPAIIIADFDMPGMNGFSLYKALSKEAILSSSSFYLMMSASEKAQLPEGTGRGGLQIILKPVNINALLQVILDDLIQIETIPHQNPALSERNSMILRGALEPEFAENLEKIILENVKDPDFNPDALSRIMGMVPTSLETKIRTAEGVTTQEIITRTRLKYARNLMNNGNSDLSEVARKAGFANKDKFFSAYKKYFGFMPGTIIDRF